MEQTKICQSAVTEGGGDQRNLSSSKKADLKLITINQIDVSVQKMSRQKLACAENAVWIRLAPDLDFFTKKYSSWSNFHRLDLPAPLFLISFGPGPLGLHDLNIQIIIHFK